MQKIKFILCKNKIHIMQISNSYYAEIIKTCENQIHFMRKS